MAQYCHASHEVYHEGVAQRAHNLSPVPFGAAVAAKATKESSYHCSNTASHALLTVDLANTNLGGEMELSSPPKKS